MNADINMHNSKFQYNSIYTESTKNQRDNPELQILSTYFLVEEKELKIILT